MATLQFWRIEDNSFLLILRKHAEAFLTTEQLGGDIMSRLRLRALVSSTVVLGMAACATQFAPLNPKPLVLRNYTIGAQHSANVGEPIFRVQQAREIPTFVTEYDYRPRGSRRTVERGTQFMAVARDAKGKLRLSNLTYDPVGRFMVSPEGDHVSFQLAGSTPQALTLDQPLFRAVTEVGNQPGAFTAELIYSGVANNIVRAVYREYVDDLARPAFSQELQYDLSGDRVIAYKSIRVRVIEATNSTIRYEVTSDEGLPWLPAPRPPVVTAP
jgi:hypothetical protein